LKRPAGATNSPGPRPVLETIFAQGKDRYAQHSISRLWGSLPGVVLTTTTQQHHPQPYPDETQAFVESLLAEFPSAGVQDGEPPLRRGGGSLSGALILDSGTHSHSTPLSIATDTPPDGPHWLVKVTDLGDDFQEITAHYREEKPRPPKHRKERRKGSRDDMTAENNERSTNRAKRRMRHAVVMLRADAMMTLTTRENLTDLDKAWSYWKQMARWLKASYAWGEHYVVVHETQARGAIHFHVALCMGEAWPQYRRIIAKWREIIGGDGSVQFSREFRCRQRARPGRIYGYLSKYLSKGFTQGQMNRKRYAISQDLPTPQETIVYLPVGDDTAFRLSQELHRISGRPPLVKFIKPGIIHFRSY